MERTVINVTLTLTDALNVLKEPSLPSILRIQLVEALAKEYVDAVTHCGKVENRVSFLEAEIRGVIELLESYRSDDRLIIKNDLDAQISHLRLIL